MNISNDSILGEFDYWKPTTIIILASQLLLLIPASLFINISILVTMFRAKPLRKSLNMIHQSIFFLNCLIIIPDIITSLFFVPQAIRFCECSQIGGTVYFLIELLFIVFHPLIYACLGIFQLLIIKGKRRWVSYKSVGASILFCIGVTTLVLVEGITLVNLAGQTYVCNGVCPEYMSAAFIGIGYTQFTYVVVSWLPSFLVMIVCTTWSCIIFKNNYTGGNDDLNRRVLSLPIVLPIILAIPSILSASFLAVTEQALKSSEIVQSAYWIVFARFLAFQIHEVISGIVFPCTVLCLNPKIGGHWREQLLLSRKCGNTKIIQVMPASGVTQTTPA